MTLNQFIKELSAIRSDLRDKDVEVVAQNGLLMPPVIKFYTRDICKQDLSKDNVEKIVITYE